MMRITLSFLKKILSHNDHDKTSHPRVTTASQFLLGSILIFSSILVFAPLYPRMPEGSLDPSWMLAMNQAVALGAVFGRDIVFTFGPYAALYTQAYHPATYPWTLTLGLMFGFCYAAMLLMALHKHGNIWLWLFAGFLFLVDSRDALFFSYPLLVAIVAYKATLPNIDPRHLVLTLRTRIDYVIAITLLGVLPIIKGSFLPLTVGTALVGFVLYWQKGAKGFASLFLLLPLLAMIVLWHMAGQPISALLDYFHSMSPIISGFAEAMSTGGSTKQIAVYIVVAVLIISSIFLGNKSVILHKVAITSCVSLFLFIAFKAGFVRHDGHALAAGSALVLAVLILNVFSISGIRWLIAVFAITVFSLFHWAYVGISLNETNIPSVRGLISGNHMGGGLQASFNQRLEIIKNESPIPILNGTADIYPYDQAALIASGNNWVSRPIPQSYSVYTPTLAKINEAHLRGPQAPDNIIFRVGTIDNRYPSIDDGLSWPTLISHYEISDKDKQYIYLKKRPTPVESKMSVVMEGSQKLGKNISVPQGEHIFFAEIDVEPTILGRLATIAFKPTPLYITVDMADGQRKTFRFIPSMAKTGFILSPLIKSTSDFTQLAGGQLPSLKQSMVNSIRIAPAGSESMFWNRDYLLKISILEPNPNPALHTQTLSSRLLTKLPE